MQRQEAPTSSAGNIIQVDEPRVRDHHAEIVRGSVERTLSTMLQNGADELCYARRYTRTAEHVSTRASTYKRNLDTKAGEVTLCMPLSACVGLPSSRHPS
jgi:transposase-like protein